MDPVVDIDHAKYKQAVRDLVQRFRVDSGEILKEESRLLVRDLMAMTPPNNPQGSGGKKLGEQAVANDIAKVFRPIRDIIARIRLDGKPQIASLVSRLLRKNKFEDAKKYILPGAPTRETHTVRDHRRNGAYVGAYRRTITVRPANVPGVGNHTQFLTEPDHKLHKQRRGSRGRVGRGPLSAIIIGQSAGQTLRQYIKDIKARVGFAMAGWMPSARKFGHPAPQWVARHSGAPGSVVDQSNATFGPQSVTMVNRSSRISGLQRIADMAVNRRLKSFASDAARILAGGKTRRGSFRGTSAFGKVEE